MLSFACAGVQKGDLVQLMTTIDRRFMAGMAYFLGLRKLGAGIIRVGAGCRPYNGTPSCATNLNF